MEPLPTRRSPALRPWVATLVAVVALAVAPLPARAQSADDLFNIATLQRVDLLINSQDWEKLKQDFQENTYYPADLRWNGQTVRNSGIRSRGLGSRSGTKPGLRVDFDRYASNQTFLGLKSIVLDNLTQDPTGIKESVTMRLFARMGVPAPRESFARLYVNNQLIGLYAVVESVDKDLLARVFGDVEGNIQNDGYLFEYNYISGAPWRFDYLGADLAPYAERFDAKTRESQSDTQKWGPIEELVRLANETPASALPSVLDPRLDLSALVRYLALQNFVAQDDGFVGYDGMNNFYFYRLEDSTRHVVIAWDEDNAFHSADFGLTTRHDQNVLVRKLMESEAWRAQYFSVLGEAADSASQVDDGQTDGWLLAEMRRQFTLIADAMREDPSKPYSNDDHAAAREALLAFPAARIPYVRCESARASSVPLPASCS
jgi:spore coat protein CotH